MKPTLDDLFDARSFFSSLTLSAYLNVFKVCSQLLAHGLIMAIIQVFDFLPKNELHIQILSSTDYQDLKNLELVDLNLIISKTRDFKYKMFGNG